MNTLDPIKALINQAWRWGLSDFLNATGFVESAETRLLFIAFQEAADRLRRFDDPTLRILTCVAAVPEVPPTGTWFQSKDALEVGVTVKTTDSLLDYPPIGVHDSLASRRTTNRMGIVTEVWRRNTDELRIYLVEHADESAPYFVTELRRMNR